MALGTYLGGALNWYGSSHQPTIALNDKVGAIFMRGFACDIDPLSDTWRLTHGGAIVADSVDPTPLALVGAGGAPTVWPNPALASPPLHQAALFSAAKGYGLAAGNSLLDSITTQDLIIELIIAADASAGYIIGSRYAAGAGVSVEVDGAGLVTCIIDDGATTRTLAAVTPLVAGVATHVLIVLDKDETTAANSGFMCLDGVVDATARVDNGSITIANVSGVGVRGDAGATYTGYIAYFAVHGLADWLPGGATNPTIVAGLCASRFARFADPTADWVDQAASEVLSKEDFESQWAVAAGGNETSISEFEDDDLDLGPMGDGEEEDFDRGWTAPEEGGELVGTVTASMVTEVSVPVAKRDYVNDSNTLFGASVALADLGTRIVVGAPAKYVGAVYCGAVYVFAWDGTYIQEILPQVVDRTNSTEYGRCIAVSGNWLIVGMPGTDQVDFHEWTGAAYTYRQTLAGATTVAGDQFGWSVDIDGATAIVGAPYDDDTAANAGCVFIMTEAAGVWSEAQKIPSPVAQATMLFGYAVAVDETTGAAAVGAREFDDSFTGEGHLYIFGESGGVYSAATDFAPPTPATGALFGESVDIDGDFILAGAGGHDVAGAPANQGSVSVYRKTGPTAWTLYQEILADPLSSEVHANFGGNDSQTSNAVAMDGDYLVVGAYGWDDGSVAGWAGSAFVLERAPGHYRQQVQLFPAEAGRHGNSVAIYGASRRVLVGASQAEADDDLVGLTLGQVKAYTYIGPSWLANSLVYGGTSGAVGRIRSRPATNTASLLHVVEGANGPFQVGEIATQVYPAIGKGALPASTRGDGTSKRFSLTGGGGGNQPWPGTVELYGLALDNSTLRVVDDGSGNLIGDIDATGVNTVDYATADFDVTFSGPLKPGARVFIIFKQTYVSTVVTSYTKTSDKLAGNTDAISEFSAADLDTSAETFEATWKEPKSFLKIMVAAGLVFTVGDIVNTGTTNLRGVVTETNVAYIIIDVFNALPDYSYTDPVFGETVSAEHDSTISTTVNASAYLHIPQAAPWNDSAVMDGSFESGAATADLASFDVGAPEDFEDFEEEWSNNENSEFAYNDPDLHDTGSATFDLGPFDSAVPEDVEDFEEEWTTVLEL